MKSLKIIPICVFLALCGCDNKQHSSDDAKDSKANQNIAITETNLLANFSNIVFAGNIKVTINNSADQNNYLIANQAALNNIDVSIKDDTLYIKSKKPIQKNSQIPNININISSLKNITTKGSTKINIYDLDSEYLKIFNKGSSKYNISGNIAKLDVETSGAILINGKKLKTLNSKIKSEGVCHIILEVAENLQIFSDGFNKILYSGNPKIDKHGKGYNIIQPISQINHEIT